MITSYLVMPSGNLSKIKPVKNLGWLCRHWQHVNYFIVGRPDYRVTVGDFDCRLEAHCTLPNGQIVDYVCNFADRKVLHTWLNRPVFEGMNLNWFGQRCTVGDSVYIALRPV